MATEDFQAKTNLKLFKDLSAETKLQFYKDLKVSTELDFSDVIDFLYEIGSTTNLYWITGILEDGDYYYGIKVADAAGNKSIAYVSKITVDGAPPPLDRLVLKTRTGPRIRLQWDLPDTEDIQSFNIYHNGGNGDVNYDTIQGVSNSDEITWISPVLPYGDWIFNTRVMDNNNLEEVSFYNEQSISIIEGGVFGPTEVSGLSAHAISDGKIQLLWESTQNNDSYSIYYDNGTGTIDYNNPLEIIEPKFVINKTGFRYDTDILIHNQTYQFVIRTTYAGEEETNTNIVSAIADAAAPATIDKLTIEQVIGGRAIEE